MLRISEIAAAIEVELEQRRMALAGVDISVTDSCDCGCGARDVRVSRVHGAHVALVQFQIGRDVTLETLVVFLSSTALEDFSTHIAVLERQDVAHVN